MTGSLQIKYEKFYIVLNYYQNGKRKQKWIATDLPVKGNKKKAEQLLRQKMQEAEQCQGLLTCDTRFSDAVRQWLENCAIRVDAVTLQGYRCHAEKHILPYFDALGIKLVDVNRQVLQKYVNEKYKHGRKDGHGGLSPASLRQHKNVLYQTLQDAVRDGLIPSNPCAMVDMPKMQPFQSHFCTVTELNAMLAEIKDEPLYPVVFITAMYGLRRSEVLGLKWDSLDLDDGTMTIKHTVSKVTETVEKDKTKNASSFRSFPLTPAAREIFAQAKKEEKENRKAFGSEYQKNDYIFKWPDGRPYSPDYVTQGFSNMLARHKLPHIRFHELRHSCASMLIANGFGLKDVQEWLGHSDIKMTANIYAHLDVQRKIGMAAEVEKLLPLQNI